MRNLYIITWQDLVVTLETCKKKRCVDTKEVVANKEDSFIQGERQIRELAVLHYFQTHTRTQYTKQVY